MVVHAYIPSIWEAERGTQVENHPWLHSKTLAQNTKKKEREKSTHLF
jgi:hypothetical protein